MTSPERVILESLLRGVSVWLENGELVYRPETAPLTPEGLSWLKRNKTALVKGLHPSRGRWLEKTIRAGMGPGWIELHREEVRCLTGLAGPQEAHMTAWARLLGKGPGLPWPAKGETDDDSNRRRSTREMVSHVPESA